MKNLFNGFYSSSEEEISKIYKNKETLFIFDTNILLTLYRCESNARDDFFEIWNDIKSQTWIPFHVCLEYQRNRLNVIDSSRGDLSAIANKINKDTDSIFKEIESKSLAQVVSRYSNLRTELTTLSNKLKLEIDEFIKKSIESRMEKIDFIDNHDSIRDRIEALIGTAIGEPPKDNNIISAINKTGADRYKHNIGPGYEDVKDKKDDYYSYNGINYHGQFADLYVWMQIIEHVKNKKIKNVVFVTNDKKPDFFYKINNKVRGPNESLVTEIKREGGAENFLLHQIDSFLHHANTNLGTSISDSSISELLIGSDDINSLNNEKSQISILEYYTKKFNKIDKDIDTLNNAFNLAEITDDDYENFMSQLLIEQEYLAEEYEKVISKLHNRNYHTKGIQLNEHKVKTILDFINKK